jgi:hypothetical protein
MEQHQLIKEGPKPRGCPLMMLKVAAVAVVALLLTWLVIS